VRFFGEYWLGGVLLAFSTKTYWGFVLLLGVGGERSSGMAFWRVFLFKVSLFVLLSVFSFIGSVHLTVSFYNFSF